MKPLRWLAYWDFPLHEYVRIWDEVSNQSLNYSHNIMRLALRSPASNSLFDLCCLHYVLRTAVTLVCENGFSLTHTSGNAKTFIPVLVLVKQSYIEQNTKNLLAQFIPKSVNYFIDIQSLSRTNYKELSVLQNRMSCC